MAQVMQQFPPFPSSGSTRLCRIDCSVEHQNSRTVIPVLTYFVIVRKKVTVIVRRITVSITEKTRRHYSSQA